jgi:4-hydroxy-L-threonine phosphate dehydrogenase PdxA
MKKAENIIVGISIGDLNGIGSEVILKTFEDSRMLELCTPVIFANVKVLSFIKKTLELTAPLHGIDKIEQLVVGKINVLNIWREGVDLNFGQNDENIGKYAIKSFVAATKALKEMKSGYSTPLSMPMASATPEPAAVGAKYTVRPAAMETKTTPINNRRSQPQTG